MPLSSSECITWFAVTLTVCAAIVTVNLLSIILFIKNRSLRTRAMYLVISLTIADMFVGGFSHFNLFRHLSRLSCDIVKMNLSLELKVIIYFLFSCFPLTSLTNIAVISLDRMHATVRPFRHRLIKKWVYGVTIAGVWVLAAMVSTVILILQLYGKERSYIYSFFLLSSYCCLCLFVICVSYSSIVVKFLCGAHPQHRGAANRQRKLTVTLFIMTIVSLLMWLPHAVLTFRSIKSSIMKFLSSQELERLYLYITILYFMNSLVNPIVYTIRMPEFRKALLLTSHLKIIFYAFKKTAKYFGNKSEFFLGTSSKALRKVTQSFFFLEISIDSSGNWVKLTVLQFSEIGRTFIYLKLVKTSTFCKSLSPLLYLASTVYCLISCCRAHYRLMLFSSSECITWFAVNLTVCVAIVTVNLLSIIVFIKKRSLRTRAMYLVINLTVADMFVGGFSNFSLFRFLSLYSCDIVKMNLSQELIVIIDFLFVWFPLTSLTTIAAVSLDRMHATIRPFRHRLIKKWVYGVTITGVWVLAAMVSTACIILRHYGEEWSHHLYLLESFHCLCLFVICVSYSSIVVKFLCGAHPQHHGAANRQRKLTVTLFIMTILSLLLWLPYAVFQSSIKKFPSVQELVRFDFSLSILYFMNSLVNPIVYTIRMPEFRKALLLLFKRQRRQNARDIPLRAL
ncbi:unnamed protein product [Porites lobata]|uniref:G-protein coupled receptors family 1 profile domain-containing protein n=1 Tax=Porites lobata TaxID=104759 RepID=A0ABN8S189_9CNID|nr:unnamed protein product [Porites lobata]